MYRDVTGQARNGAPHCPAADWLGVAGGNGVIPFKSPLTPWLGENGLALSVLLRGCLWLGWLGKVRLGKVRTGETKGFGAGGGPGLPRTEDVVHTIIASS